ncbi:MAG: hypothetical protein JOY92_08295, partial [Verrucomicrobia bacterium]|nr:hypothetical protein [Verrucomicrobiota bacterium]
MKAAPTHPSRRLEPKISFSRQPAVTPDSFVERHIGPREADLREMLQVIGCASLEE